MTDVFAKLLAPADADGRLYGVSVGIVTNTNDPRGMGRVKVRLPWMSATVESAWARVAAPMAGPGCGVYFQPAVDDEVLVAFEHGSAEFPYVLGGLWNGRDKPPESSADGRNDVRTIKSRSGHVIRFTDAKGGERIEVIDHSGQNHILIDSAAGTVEVTAKGRLTLNGAGIEIKSTSDVTIEAGAGMTIKAGAQLDLNGRIVNIN